MMTTVDILDALRARYGLTSDYQLAKLLGLARQQISQYRSGRCTLGDLLCLRVAELLDLDPGYVLASMAAERESRPAVRKVWERLAASLAGLVMAVGAATLPVWQNGLCIMSSDGDGNSPTG